MKLNLKSTTFTMNLVDAFIILGKGNQSKPKKSTCASFITRYTTPKLLFYDFK
jgi:hypothetical protein